MIKQLNGWQRLWVVVVGVSAIATGLFISTNYETESSVDQSYQSKIKRLQETKHILLHLTAPAKKDKNSFESILGVASDQTVDEVNLQIFSAGVNYEAELKSLPSDQVKAVIIPVIVWLIANGLLYVLGITGAWVYRGFRPKKV